MSKPRQAARAALELAKRLGVRWAIDVAVPQLRAARALLANPATLPPSFRR